MGFVYLAHEALLNRDVAIKVLRPELGTAQGDEAFLREAQILASISHPNVVVIYRTGEGEGLQYYVMELMRGPTLATRLESGPLPWNDVVSLGSDILKALAQMHRLGFVHRDVKPGNIFLLPDRALLGDFGIARTPPRDNEAPDRGGTPDYMAPEQSNDTRITPHTDIYSMGVTLYEAATGRRFHPQGASVSWEGVRADLARVLQRAVAQDPAERWPDAATFREALRRTRKRPTPTIIVIIASGAAVAGLAGALFVGLRGRPAQPPLNPRNPNVAFESIEYVGPGDRRPIADSLFRMIQSDLSPHINFVTAGARTNAVLSVRARMSVTGARASVRLAGGIPASEFHVPLDSWSALGDSVAYQIVLGVWADRSPLARSLPPRALPRTAEGLMQFLEAEQYVAETRWQKADVAYRLALSTDSTCWICGWRLTEVGRWLGREPDPQLVRWYSAHAESLESPYRSLIRAARLPLRERLDTLRQVTEDSRDFFLGWFQLGDELFHRGPLVGHRRAEAIPAFERAARLQPNFRPSWEHLAWAATAEGDSADAANALRSLENQSVAPDAFSAELHALLRVGFVWRFLPDSTATRMTSQISSAPGMQTSADFGAGPRLLPTFEVPRGAIALGEMLAQTPSHDFQRSGLIAQILGALALGRVDSTQSLTRRLREVAPEPALDLFSAELRGVLALLDSEAVSVDDGRNSLQLWLLHDDTELRHRATWVRSLLDQRSRFQGPAPLAFQKTMTAEQLVAGGQTRGALRLVDRINVDSVARRGDPFFRTLVHFRRAAWRASIGDIEGAKADLIWHEHLDLAGLPTELPQAAEVDWAFGTLARWRLARLLDPRGESCEPYASVIRNWSGAPAPYGARADTARIRARALRCAQTR